MASIEITGLDEMKERIKKAPQAIELSMARAINRTLAKANTQVSKEVRKDVNLTARYVKSLINISKATRGRLQGGISIRGRNVQLSRYAAKQVTRAAVRAAGDPSRAIPAGRKQAGVRVKVKARGSSNVQPKFFFIKLRSGNEEGDRFGVAVRTGPGRGDYEVKYGPSVVQIVNQIKDELKSEWRQEVIVQFDREFNRITRRAA